MISVGMNRKLGKKIGVFNLPARKTCPGKTEYCGKCCYAMKAEKCYPSAKASRAKNYIESKKEHFAENMDREIMQRKISSKMRIHESGDFYSQEYLDKWIEVVTRHPEIQFLAYTKMFAKLDFSKAPKNLILYASLDPDNNNDRHSIPFNFRACKIVDDKKDAPKGWYICNPMKDTGHHNYCGETCLVCWKGSKNAVWIKH